jgi:hypothetical protein
MSKAFQKCLIVLVEMSFGLDKDCTRQVIEAGKRAVDKVFRESILQEKPLVN